MRILRLVSLLVACSVVPGCVSTLPAEPGDSERVVTAGRLAELGLELPDDYRSYESLKREQIVGGVINIEYEFEMPDGGPPYVFSLAELHPTPKSACSSFSAGNFGVRLSRLELDDRSDLFRYGEKSRFAIVTNEGSPVGNLFSMCHGRTAFLVMFVGIYFDESGVWHRFISPHLRALEAMEASGDPM